MHSRFLPSPSARAVLPSFGAGALSLASRHLDRFECFNSAEEHGWVDIRDCEEMPRSMTALSGYVHTSIPPSTYTTH
jgi:hypothetical protein